MVAQGIVAPLVGVQISIMTPYGAVVYRLGHHPFKVKSRVQLPVVLPNTCVAQWQSGGLIPRMSARLAHDVGSSPTASTNRCLAQLGEQLPYKQ